MRKVDCMFFSPIERLRTILEKVIKKGLMVNNIYDDLVFK